MHHAHGTTSSASSDHLQVKKGLRNAGVGPARIKSYELVVGLAVS